MTVTIQWVVAYLIKVGLKKVDDFLTSMLRYETNNGGCVCRYLECYEGNILHCMKRHDRKPRMHQWRLLWSLAFMKWTPGGSMLLCFRLLQNNVNL